MKCDDCVYRDEPRDVKRVRINGVFAIVEWCRVGKCLVVEDVVSKCSEYEKEEESEWEELT